MQVVPTYRELFARHTYIYRASPTPCQFCTGGILFGDKSEKVTHVYEQRSLAFFSPPTREECQERARLRALLAAYAIRRSNRLLIVLLVAFHSRRFREMTIVVDGGRRDARKSTTTSLVRR